MRIIKFRGKRVRDEQWVTGSLVEHSDGRCSIFNEQDIMVVEHDVFPYSVGQFTGLHDSAFNDIYEGDVISYFDMLQTHELTVLWDTSYGQWIAMTVNGEEFTLPLGQIAAHSLITGNSYSY